MQADGFQDLLSVWNRGDAGDPYPGIGKNYTFNSTSNPNSKAYSGADTFVSVYNIPQEPAVSVTVNVTVKALDQPPTGDFDPKFWYRIKNTYQPGTYSLDVIDSDTTHIEMGRDANKGDQFWQFKANTDGTYFIRSLFAGSTKNLDLEDWNKSKPQIRAATGSTSQYWKVGGWGDGTWHIENVFVGKDRYLDTMEGDKKVELNQANTGRPTQRWTITKIRPITEAGF
jgi:immune inhibitor A